MPHHSRTRLWPVLLSVLVAPRAAGLADIAHALPARPLSPTAPAAPSNLRQMPSTLTEIRLEWIDNSRNESGFRIEAATVISAPVASSNRDAPVSGDLSGATYKQVGAVGPGSCDTVLGTSCMQRFTHSGLSPDTVLRYRVRAFNRDGLSAASNEITAKTLPTLPSAPSNLIATEVVAGRVALRWTDNSNNETGFEVFRGDLRIVAQVTTNTYSDLSAPASSTVTYRVRARNATGASAFSNTLVVSTPAPVTSPTNVTATAQSASSIKVTWQHSGNRTGFRIVRASGTSTRFFDRGEVAGTALEFLDTGLPASSTYTYRVITLNGNSTSFPSAAATATTNAGSTPNELAWAVRSGSSFDVHVHFAHATLQAQALHVRPNLLAQPLGAR